MICVKVTFSDGDTLTTSINGTLESAGAYYIGNWFNLGPRGDQEDYMVKAVAVELVE